MAAYNLDVKSIKLTIRAVVTDPSLIGPQGPKGEDAPQPFKGWFEAGTTETSNLPANPTVGDYAYVQTVDGEDNPITKVYDCVTTGTWHDSGRTVDTGEVGQLEQKVDGLVYDVTKENTGSPTFASLSALLSDANLSTLIPTSVRTGGMSIRFVQSSDNKYVQYRYMGTDVTGTPNPFLDTTNWQGVSNGIVAGSDDLAKSGDVYDAIEEHSSFSVTDEGGFHVIDENLNVGMKYDENGLDAAKVSSHFIEVLKAAGISADDVMSSHASLTNEDGFFITDEELNIGVKVDSDGIHAKNILEYEIVED